jgi:hypothetical protein
MLSQNRQVLLLRMVCFNGNIPVQWKRRGPRILTFNSLLVSWIKSRKCHPWNTSWICWTCGHNWA